ncbi:molybdate ABC transporter substrate-binding protein, partial [Candidatus Nitrotoga sp. HW29]|uniref:molybdate ABC transporter substrate-binding protein n=1 Tax=Candidatus Nitrotoga sp. HW29 TaxID=2886963 RepID=UPI001EF2247D
MTKIFHTIVIAAAFAIGSGIAMAETITVVTASSMKFAMTDIVNKFNAEHRNDEVKTIYGASGKFTSQIQNGAPFDMFFAADTNFPQILKKEGLTSTDPVVYATGKLVIWSSTTDATKLTLQKLSEPAIRKLAIANPDLAPYGMRAKEAMNAARVWGKIKDKLVFGENVEHTAQMVSTGAADAGLIPLSLALNPAMVKQGGYSLIDDSLHQSLAQAFVITKRAKDSALARQ